MVAKEILRVLYAPHKVFKDIIQKPGYLGPFILLIIFTVAYVGSVYVVASKSYVEQTIPVSDQEDSWTQDATLWQAAPGVSITNNYADFINATPVEPYYPVYYGNSSVEFAANDSSNIQMTLIDLGGSVNCGSDGFKNVSFRVKILAPEAKPENVSLYLYSLSDLNFFYYDLTSLFFSSVVNVWNNITLPVGSGDWLSSNTAASWGNITSLKMVFAWSSNSSIDLLIDGLFFRGNFTSPLESDATGYLINYGALPGSTQFIFQWLLLTALIYLIIKGLKGNVVWKPLMVAVGFALVVMVIQALILVVVYATLPKLYYPLEYWTDVPGESQVVHQLFIATTATVFQISGVVQIAVYVWIVAVGAIITHEVTGQTVEGAPSLPQFGWMKSVLVSVASLLLRLLILIYVGL